MPPARRKPAAKGSPEPPPAEVEPEESAEPGRSAQRVPRSLFLNEELLERARAAVTELAAYHPESGVRSLSDIFEPAAWTEVERLEKEFNGGKPFRKVARMPTGRPRE